MRYLVLIIAFFVVGNTFGQVGSKNFIDQNYVEVTGSAELKVMPDEIYLSIVLDENQDRTKDLKEKEMKMIKALSQLGIDVKNDLTVNDFSSHFKDAFLGKDQVKQQKQFQLLVSDAKTVSRVFTELKKLYISNITIKRFDHSNMNKLENDVRVLAAKKAKRRAKAIVEGLGQSVGKAIYIQDYEIQHYQPRHEVMMMKSESLNRGGKTEAVDFQKIVLKARMVVRFEMK